MDREFDERLAELRRRLEVRFVELKAKHQEARRIVREAEQRYAVWSSAGDQRSGIAQNRGSGRAVLAGGPQGQSRLGREQRTDHRPQVSSRERLADDWHVPGQFGL